MKRPFLVVAVCFSLGIVSDSVGMNVGFALGGPRAVFLGCLVVVCCWLIVLAAYVGGRRIQRPDPTLIFPLLYFFAATAALICTGWMTAIVSSSSHAPVRWQVVEVNSMLKATFIATVADLELDATRQVRLGLGDVRLIRTKTTVRLAGRLLVTADPPNRYHPDGKAKTEQDAAQQLPALHEGDEIRVHCRPFPLAKKRNPYDFDYGAYLTRRGFMVTCSVAGTDLTIQKHLHNGLLYRIQRLRSVISNRIRVRFNDRTVRSIISAIILGQTRNIDLSVVDDFRSTGLAHLLAISGLHTGIVGLSCYWLAGLWGTRLRFGMHTRSVLRVAMTLIPLLLYAVVSGGSASVMRSVIMTLLYVTGREAGLRVDGWNILGLSALMILIARPAALYTVGFQLSYAALAGIFLSLSVGFSGNRPTGRRLISGYLITSLSILVTTAPVLLYHFGVVPLAGLAANAIAIPVTALIVLSGFLTVLLPPLDLISISTGELVHFLVAFVHVVSIHASFAMIQDAPARFPGGALLLIVGLFSLASSGKLRVFLLILFLSAAAVSSPIGLFRARSGLQLLFFDVGQGDAALVLFPSGRSLLIDTGPSTRSGQSIVRTLRHYGIERLDGLVLSHFHRDHVGGLETVLKNINVDRLIVPGPVPAGLERARLQAISTAIASAGDTLHFDANSRSYVIAPYAASVSGGNAASLVLQIRYGEITILFTGDAEFASEREITKTYGHFLQSSILKVAHHGSKTSSNEFFLLRSVKPVGTTAIISVRRHNRFGHPSMRVVRRLVNYGASLCATSWAGGIGFRSDGHNLVSQNTTCSVETEPSVIDEQGNFSVLE